MRIGVSVAGLVVLTTCVTLASTGPAAAQDSRADEIARKQAEKAAVLASYRPTKFETVMNGLERSFTSPPDGFYPVFGNVYTGGGLAAGPGYRRFFGRKAVWTVHGLYSIRNYKLAEFNLRTPWNGAGRTGYGVRVGWRDATQVPYFGLGLDSSRGDRTSFRLKETYAEVHGFVRPTRWTRLRMDVAYEDYQNERAAGGARRPSIETRFDASTAPGLFSHPTYVHTDLTAAIDWRTAPGYTRRGGYYGLTLADYTDVDKTYSFRRADANIIQHLPILRETWILSLRARVQTILDDNDVVPYYLLPFLGSSSTLRGFATTRFRDRHSLLTSAEFRWIPNRMGMDMALFYDAGKVTSRREDLDLSGLESDWGLGMRLHALTATFLRIEVARSREGTRLVVSTNTAF